MSDSSRNDEIIRQILDERSHAALCNLKHINKLKSTTLQDILLKHYENTHKKIFYDEYLEVVRELEKRSFKSEICYKRKNDLFDLSDDE